MTEAAQMRPEEETLRALLRRADALTTACVVVERDEWGYPEAKAEMLRGPAGCPGLLGSESSVSSV